MKFVKMHGLGNDFVVFEGPIALDARQIASLCDRRRGIGADGVLIATPKGESVRMEYWNADGSAAEMCGNGLRCVTRFAVDQGWVSDGPFMVSTAVGDLEVVMIDEQTARVEIGTVSVGDQVSFDQTPFVSVSVGNPHAVTFVDDTDVAPVATVGSALELATVGGTNVEFAQLLDSDIIAVRTWERGAGETLACGTGAVAVAAAARSHGTAGDDTTIRLLGGDLRVELEGNRAWITGPALYSFWGEWLPSES